MTCEMVLSDLDRKGIRLSVRGDRLIVNAPRGVLTEQLKSILRQLKPELLELLTDPTIWARRASALLSDVEDASVRADLRELFEHRAAVAEYDGEQNRGVAERIAYRELRGVIEAREEVS